MDGWEDKLSAVLNDPRAMGQILELARSLEGGTAPPPAEEPPSSPAEGPAEPPGVDPRLLELGLRALSAWQGEEDDRTRLLEALRPFIRPERHEKLDKAIRAHRLSRAVRQVLEGLKGGETDV